MELRNFVFDGSTDPSERDTILPNHPGFPWMTREITVDPGLQGIHEISREKKFANLSKQATKITRFSALMCLLACVIGQPSPRSCKYWAFLRLPYLTITSVPTFPLYSATWHKQLFLRTISCYPGISPKTQGFHVTGQEK